jgi:hypothetical protein
MATYTKKLLSGSTNGKQIKVTATTNGTAITVHTAVAGTASFDEIWLYAYNEDTVARQITILFGGVTEPDNAIRAQVLPKQGRLILMDGVLLQNSLVVKAYADAANVINLDGFVNQIV